MRRYCGVCDTCAPQASRKRGHRLRMCGGYLEAVPRPGHDIESREDLYELVDLFYARAMADPLIGYIFTDVARLDMERHRPVITSFWEKLLFGSGDYAGGAFVAHARIHLRSPLQWGHFDRWVALWSQTVGELFVGPVADAAVAHGRRIASAFSRRLGEPDFDRVPPVFAPLEIRRYG